MALIKCPECGKVFSDRAAHCPQCGLPTSDALEMITSGPQPAAQPITPAAPAPPTAPAPASDTPAAPVTNTPSAPALQPQEPQAFREPELPENPAWMNYAPRYNEREQPKKQRNLLTLILIVAVIVLAIVCIALVFTTSGVLNNDEEDINADTVTTMQTLPPDTTPARVETPEAKPVIRTVVPEEVIPAESEEIEIEAPAATTNTPAAPAPPTPTHAPEPAPAPTTPATTTPTAPEG